MSLSTAAVLAAGAPPALAADVPEFQVDVTASPKEVAEAGDFITLSVTVTAKNPEAEEIKEVAVKTTTKSSDDANTSVDPLCEPSPCVIEVATDDAPKEPIDLAKVTAQKTITAKVSVNVVVAIDSVDPIAVEGRQDDVTLTFTPVPKPSPSPSPRPTPTPTPSPGQGKKPSDGKEDKGEDKKDDDDGGSGGSGSSGSGGSSSSGSGYTPPSPNASFTPPPSSAPGVSLPSIAPPSPSLAPGPTSPTPESRLRNNKAPVAQDLTFERIASTQVAWLAALLAAFSLLLTQLRLGRRRALPGAAPAVAARRKGAHRRPRRGAFGK